MKTVLILSFLALFITLSAKAKNYVFVGSSEWNGSNAMDVLETQGIKMNAVQNTLEECLKDGNQLCALKSSKISSFNTKKWSKSQNSFRRYTKVESVIQSIDELPLEEGETYTGTDSWQSGIGLDVLSALGVKAGALETAIQKCQKDGNHFCTILNVTYTQQNQRDYNKTAARYVHVTSAQAIVRGYTVR